MGKDNPEPPRPDDEDDKPTPGQWTCPLCHSDPPIPHSH